MNEKFKGIFPALLTPFDGQDRVNTRCFVMRGEKAVMEGLAVSFMGKQKF